VGLSTPKQEKFMAQYWQNLDATLLFGVGLPRFSRGPRPPGAALDAAAAAWNGSSGSAANRAGSGGAYLRNNPLFACASFAR